MVKSPVSPSSTSSTTNTSTNTNTDTKLKCDCWSYTEAGKACPCSVQHAIRVGRRARERMLYKSHLFTDTAHHHHHASSNDNRLLTTAINTSVDYDSLYTTNINVNNNTGTITSTNTGTITGTGTGDNSNSSKDKNNLDTDVHSCNLGSLASRSFEKDNTSVSSTKNTHHLHQHQHDNSHHHRKCYEIGPDHIFVDTLLGKGGFCEVHSVQISPQFSLLPTSSANHTFPTDTDILVDTANTPDSTIDLSNHHHQHHFNDNNYSDDHYDHDTNQDIHNAPLVIKFLQSSVMLDRKKFARGVADLVIEAHFLYTLQHPHIISLRGVSIGFTPTSHLPIQQLQQQHDTPFLATLTNIPGKQSHCYLLLDKLADTLVQKIYNHWKPSTIKYNGFFKDFLGIKRRSIKSQQLLAALQLSQAMLHIHRHNIIYRDLKPENVGFTLQTNIDHQDCILKLFDFGLAKELKSHHMLTDGTYALTAYTGSRRYMSPEVALGQSYNLSADVFSYGILLWEILTVTKPFEGFTELMHMNQVIKSGLRPKLSDQFYKNWPYPKLKVLITECWHPQLKSRPSFDYITDTLQSIYDSDFST